MMVIKFLLITIFMQISTSNNRSMNYYSDPVGIILKNMEID